jgi:hypothetical protein
MPDVNPHHRLSHVVLQRLASKTAKAAIIQQSCLDFNLIVEHLLQAWISRTDTLIERFKSTYGITIRFKLQGWSGSKRMLSLRYSIVTVTA